MNKLQTVLDALEQLQATHARFYYTKRSVQGDEAIAIVRQMMQAEPMAYIYVKKESSVDVLTFDDAPADAVDGTLLPLFFHPAPQAVPAEPSCPDCNAPGLLYECVHCSASNYPPKAAQTAQKLKLYPIYKALNHLVSQFLQRGVSTDKEHPDRIAIDNAERQIKKVHKAMLAAAPAVKGV
jgi:hypothetical protein